MHLNVAINKILFVHAHVILTEPHKFLCSYDFLRLFFFLFAVYFATKTKFL